MKNTYLRIKSLRSAIEKIQVYIIIPQKTSHRSFWNRDNNQKWNFQSPRLLLRLKSLALYKKKNSTVDCQNTPHHLGLPCMPLVDDET